MRGADCFLSKINRIIIKRAYAIVAYRIHLPNLYASIVEYRIRASNLYTSVNTLCLPIYNVPFLGTETEANFGNWSSVEGVFFGIAQPADLFKSRLGRAVVFQFHHIDTLRHQERQIASSLCTWFLSADVGSKSSKQGVEQGMIVMLVAIVGLPVVGYTSEECLDGFDEVAEVVIIAKIVVCIEEYRPWAIVAPRIGYILV